MSKGLHASAARIRISEIEHNCDSNASKPHHKIPAQRSLHTASKPHELLFPREEVLNIL